MVESSDNKKIKYYVLQVVSFIATLILSILTIKVVLRALNFENYYPIAYFMVFGAVFVFVKQYFSSYSYKSKLQYLVVTVICIIMFYLIFVKLI